MRVLVIGDTHLRHGDRRNAVRLRALEQILARAQALAADAQLLAVVWPGDLFHEESGIPDRNALRRLVRQLAALAPLVIVKGNHDRPGDLDIFADLEAPHAIHLVTEPRVVRIARAEAAQAELAIACLPYPEKGALVAANLPADAIGAAVARAFDAVFLELGQQLARFADAGVPTLFAGHVTIAGAELSVGQPLIGQDLQIDATHLSRLPSCTVKVLNHIHKPQTLHGAHYVGSIAPVDYGEVERKRFVELESGSGEWQVHSVALDVPPMYHVEGLLSGQGFEWIVKRGPDGPVETPPASFAGCDVRLRYRFASADAGLVDLWRARILADFAAAAHLELEPVAIVEREVRAPEVAKAETLAEKVAAWATSAGLATDAGVLAKLAALETTDPASLLADVQARLDAWQEASVAA